MFLLPSLRVALVVCVSALPIAAQAAKTITAEPKTGSDVVELFSAIDKDLIKVTVIPQDSTKLTIQVENRADKPLSIKLPTGFVAVPVLAQFGLPPNQAKQQGGNQAVGGQFGRNNGFNIGGNNGFNFGGNNNRQNNPGFFNIPPGKIIKKRIECVCLEHGKPDPKPQIAYEIRPLESFTEEPSIGELMALFSSGEHSQRVTQLAAWHLSNDMSWQELADLSGKHLNGKTYRLYSDNEVRQARELVGRLPSSKQPDSTTASTR